MLMSIDWKTAENSQVRATMERSLNGAGWSLQDFTVGRYRISTGMVSTSSGRVSTGGHCFRVADVVSALGNPSSLTLAEPLGFLDISTPTRVAEYLSTAKVHSLGYTPNPGEFYSFEFQTQTGCFHYVRVRLI
jgi:hypothetical protein